MVPTVKEILFSRTIPEQSVEDLKVINQDMWKKDYHIYSAYLWYSLLLTLSSYLIHPFLIK